MGNPSWDQNFKICSTLSELISKLSEYFYFGLFLEQSLGFKVIGKNYPVRIASPETHETRAYFFRNVFFRDRVWTYLGLVSSPARFPLTLKHPLKNAVPSGPKKTPEIAF